MLPNPLLQLTDWNPQFFREFKGRLKSRTVLLTVVTSGLFQGLILFYLWLALPGKTTSYNRYCMGHDNYGTYKCTLDALGNPQISWERWRLDLFQTLSWLLPFVLLIAGVYLLIADLAREERHGTLNFIRLSPRSSQSILLGKLLGVPLVPFLAVIVAVPLHLWSAILANIPLTELISFYLVAVVACGFCFTAAMFYALFGRAAYGWLGAAALWFCYAVFFQIWQLFRSMEYPWYFGPTEWYFVPISRNLLFAVIFALVNFAIATCWIWRSMNRRFRNPNLPSISKGQSYLMTVSFEILIFGLIFRSPEDGELFHSTYDLIGLTAINLVWFLLLIAALTPHRQTLLDWTRYRRQGTAHAGPGFWRRSQVKDLVWGDKSPALVAIALNLMIPIGIFTPWILTWGDLGQQGLAGLTLLFNFTFLLICAAIFQSLLLIKSQRRASVAIAVLANLIILPPLAMVVLGAHPSSVSALPWLLSGFAFAALEFASTPTIFLGLLAHLSLLTLITIRLTHQLRRAGESEMKILMAVGR